MKAESKNQSHNPLNYEFQDRTYIHLVSFQHPKFFINTTPKTASSWCHERFERDENSAGGDNGLMVNINDFSLEYDYDNDPHSKTAIERNKMWESLVLGKSCKKDFIFLIRNPLEKVVTGFVQDVLNYNLNEKCTKTIVFKNYISSLGYSEYEVDSFLDYYDPRTHDQRFPNVNKFGPDNIFLPMFYHVLETIIDNWFSDVPRVIREVNEGHMSNNLIFILKLLNFPPHKFDSSKIRIMDINRQDIGATLNGLYGTKINTKKMHARDPVFKHLVYLAFYKHINLLSSFLNTELVMYSEIINKLYPCGMYNGKNLPMGVFSAEEYVKNEHMPPRMQDLIKEQGTSTQSLIQMFSSKTDNAASMVSKIVNKVNNEGAGKIENILQNQSLEKLSSNASSQYLVDNLI